MVWRALFKKTTDKSTPEPPTAMPGKLATEKPVPPHLAQVIERRSTGGTPPTGQDPQQRKVAGLHRQRLAILFDIEQGELAAAPENPWVDRIGLLTEAMTTVEDDIAAATIIDPGPYHPVPEIPIVIEGVETGDATSVVISVSGETFTYTEAPDWAERGHQITHPELVLESGNVELLIHNDVPDSFREGLSRHLTDSLFVLASDLRDHALDNEEFPQEITLARLANPCPTCGGWTDWRGTCQSCANRNARIAALKREETHLLDERSTETEDRHRLIEGLPLARRRLRDVEIELTKLGESFS